MPEGTSRRSGPSSVFGGPHEGELTAITINRYEYLPILKSEKSQKQFQALVRPGSKWME